MKSVLLRTAAAIAAAVLLCPAALAAPGISARSAILMDADSGRVLYEKDADRRSLIASTTKIMTGLLAAESGRLAETVTVPPEAAGVEGSSMYLKAGEELTVEQLLYGLMLRSGNDAAVALAVTLSGSVEDFAAVMNRRAEALGLENTRYANPNGLDDENNYSTARDLARLSCRALENETFRRVVSTKSYAFGERSLTNHNKLLWRYEGAIGVKTGYTRAAGRILVSAAERDGRRLVAVTIDAPSDWSDHAAMLDYGFSAYTVHTAAEAEQRLDAVRVVGGKALLAQCVPLETLSYPLTEGETAEVRVSLPRFVFAPVLAGGRAGTLELLVNGETAARTELIWADSVPALPEPKGWLQRLLGM